MVASNQFIIRAPLGGSSDQAYQGWGAHAQLVETAAATRYATREIAELHNQGLVGGTVVEDPATAPYWAFISFLRESEGSTLDREEVEARFRTLFPEPRTVTEAPEWHGRPSPDQ